MAYIYMKWEGAETPNSPTDALIIWKVVQY